MEVAPGEAALRGGWRGVRASACSVLTQVKTIGCLVGRRAVFSANDKLLDAYKDLPTTDEEYVIEAILDERRRGVETAFRVKWRVRP